jgi:hypothetical protein
MTERSVAGTPPERGAEVEEGAGGGNADSTPLAAAEPDSMGGAAALIASATAFAVRARSKGPDGGVDTEADEGLGPCAAAAAAVMAAA